jgi:hypothetical protein
MMHVCVDDIWVRFTNMNTLLLAMTLLFAS